MSSPATASAASRATSVTRSARAARSASRRSASRPAVRKIGIVLLVALLAIGVGIANAVLEGSNDKRAYSPGSLSPTGVAALATLLDRAGVSVTHVRTSTDLAQADSATTVVLTDLYEVSDSEAKRARDSGATVVILGTKALWDADQLQQWGFPDTAWTSAPFSPDPESLSLREQPIATARATETHCPLANLVENSRRGSTIAPVSQVLIDAGAAQTCFSLSDGVAWARSPRYHNVEYFGAAATLTNKYLAQYDNAGVAIRLLARQPKVLWVEGYTSEELLDTPQPTGELPEWFTLAMIALALSGGWYAVYRARHFGKLVAEPLPVVVPAEEANYGRARLYQANSADAHAAHALRAAFIARYAARLGVSPRSSQADVIQAVASTAGADPQSVAQALYTYPVRTEADLAQMQAQLAALEKEFSNAISH